MGNVKSLDEIILIRTLLNDVQRRNGTVFNSRALRLTLQKLESRARAEGLGFLTKTLPKLGKAFDKALAGDTSLNAIQLGFKPLVDSKLPRFLGEFISLVLDSQGRLLPHPCANCVRIVREICYLFYKYKLPYTSEQEQQVTSKFEKTETDLSNLSTLFRELEKAVAVNTPTRRRRPGVLQVDVLREARYLLQDLFAFFDPTDIRPRHGPGVVATKQQLWGKYLWTNVSSRITDMWPLDAYFYASLTHVCDRLDTLASITTTDHSAKVILVPKDSRGPRLISCEPIDFQWIQQGLGRAVVQLVERHPLTRDNVRFTDQEPNRMGALAGSANGRYATLDLNEASDRVSLDLVRLLFPDWLVPYLEASRSHSTELPDGRIIKLHKYAPMGSSLCFPILALTIWSILTASAPDAYTRERIYVYGDDVIVPTAHAANAIEQLESFGLKVNRDKSCISGFFRESCGMDAFKGTDVTPVRLRTVWSSTPAASVYTSWIAYANSFYDRHYYSTYDYIVGELNAVYGAIPDDSMFVTCPRLRVIPHDARSPKRRWNKNLQKFEYRVFDVKSPSITKDIDGWSMLLRYFAETGASVLDPTEVDNVQQPKVLDIQGSGFSASQYTKRRTSILVRRWR